MDIIILIAMAVGLILHRHLSAYWEQGNLPFAHGFILFVWIFNIVTVINFVWLFGFKIGLVLAALTFFQITYSSFLWPFAIPGLIRQSRQSPFEQMKFYAGPSKTTYGSWSIIVIGLLALTILNFFVGEYLSLTDKLLLLTNNDLKVFGMFLISGIFIGNILRFITMKLLVR